MDREQEGGLVIEKKHHQHDYIARIPFQGQSILCLLNSTDPKETSILETNFRGPNMLTLL